MGLGKGPGKTYWVHLIKHQYGTLEECIKFMEENKPINEHQWYELRPDVNVKKEICTMYMCDLVEIAK